MGKDELIREKMEEDISTIHHSGIRGIRDCTVHIEEVLHCIGERSLDSQ
jgi:hypothetical protein